MLQKIVGPAQPTEGLKTTSAVSAAAVALKPVVKPVKYKTYIMKLEQSASQLQASYKPATSQLQASYKPEVNQYSL